MKIKYPIGGFAPGQYQNECVDCKETFVGDKYSRQCEPCAINAINDSNRQAIAELRQIKAALKNIKFSNDAINKALGDTQGDHVNDSFSSGKDYDKLFKDKYKEDRREGSVYPSLFDPEVVFRNGKWLNVKTLKPV